MKARLDQTDYLDLVTIVDDVTRLTRSAAFGAAEGSVAERASGQERLHELRSLLLAEVELRREDAELARNQAANIQALRNALDYIDGHDDASHAARALRGEPTPACCNGHGLNGVNA